MAATVVVHCFNSTNAATDNGAVSAIAFLSTDSHLADATTRQNNPVTAGTNSFEKHLRFKMTVAPAVSCSNWRVWTPTSQVTNVNLRAKGNVGTGGASPSGDSTPTATAMTGDVSLYSYTSQGSSYQVDSTSYSTINHYTKAWLLQLQPQAAATPGTWTQHTIGYSYDEI